MRKIISICIPIAVATMVITGCSTQQAVSPQPASQEQTAPKPSSQEQTNASKPPAEPKLVVKEGTGQYTGMIDGNSVEIIVNGEPKAFRLTEVSKPLVEKLKTKAQVSFHYSEGEQLVLQDIKVVK